MNAHAYLIVSVRICAFLAYIGLTEAIIILHNVPISPGQFQSNNADPKEMNDNYNRMLRFPHIFSFVRRNLDSFFNSWNNGEKKEAIVTTPESVERNKEKVQANDYLSSTQKNITGQFQPSSTDSKGMSEDHNRMLPFSPIFSLFKCRNLNPFFNCWNKGEKKEVIVTTPESVERNKEKVHANDSLSIILKNITEPSEDQLTQTHSRFGSYQQETTASKETSSKLHTEEMKNNTDHFAKVFPFSHARFLRFHRLPYYPFENAGKRRNDEARISREKRNRNVPQLTSTLNSTTGKFDNDLQMDNTRNCTYKQFILRHISIWTFNWVSLCFHLALILLLSIFVFAGLLLCISYCMTWQSRSALLKAKPLDV